MTGSDQNPLRIRQVGAAAREMLASPAFAHFVNAASDHHLSQMVATAVGEVGRAQRERHHAVLTALSDIHDFAKQAEWALQELEKAEAPEADGEDFD